MNRTLSVLVATLVMLTASTAFAQDTEQPAPDADTKTQGDETPEKPAEEEINDQPTKIETPKTSTADADFEAMPEMAPETLEELTVTKSYPYIEHHGLFRFRADAFYNLDLNTAGTSIVLPPASAYVPELSNPVDADAEWLSGANIRFRYEPKIHIYEDLAIKLTVDAPHNLLLGSRPDTYDVPLDAFSPGQQPLTGENGLAIREAYGEVTTFFAKIRAGRMASHWGLGILANDGKCADCDYGDLADRVQVITKAFDTYGFVSYDFPGEGPSTFQERANQGRNPQGVARDIDQLDDIEQWAFGILRKPLSKEEKAQRIRTLREDRKPVFNGGFYFVYRTQEASFEPGTRGDLDDRFEPATPPTLAARQAKAYIPDLWLQMEWEPSTTSYLRLELEAAAVLGDIQYVKEPSSNDVTDCFGENATDRDCEKLSREVKQFGLAFEAEFRANQFFSTGLNAGYATGRKGFGFQVNDGAVNPENSPSNFRFDRDYHVDMILYRELIGAVTNSMYVAPWVQFDFFTRNRDSLGLKFSTLYARAVEAEATSSGEAGLGVEFDTLLFYKEHNKYQADIAYGLLVPLAGFDAVEGGTRYGYPEQNNPTFADDEAREAEIAHTIQARLFWFY